MASTRVQNRLRDLEHACCFAHEKEWVPLLVWMLRHLGTLFWISNVSSIASGS